MAAASDAFTPSSRAATRAATLDQALATLFVTLVLRESSGERGSADRNRTSDGRSDWFLTAWPQSRFFGDKHPFHAHSQVQDRVVVGVLKASVSYMATRASHPVGDPTSAPITAAWARASCCLLLAAPRLTRHFAVGAAGLEPTTSAV